MLTGLYDKHRVGQAESTLTFTNWNPIVNYPSFSANLMQSFREKMAQALMRHLSEKSDHQTQERAPQTQGRAPTEGEENDSKLKAETMS